MTMRRPMLPAAIAAAVGLPLLALAVRAFADEWRAPALWPQEWGLRAVDVAAGDPQLVAALAISAAVATLTTAVALIVAWPAARVLGERRLRRPWPVFLLLALPLLVPPYAVGSGLVEWYLRLGVADTPAGLVLAHLVLALPYAVLLLIAAFGPELRRHEEMAGVSGLSPFQRLRWVTLPSTRPTVAAAALLTFLVSWSQYGTSLAVAPSRPTLPVIMLPYVGNDPQVAAALALLFLAPAIAAVAVAVRAIGRVA